MTAFILACAILVVASLVFMLRPLLRRHSISNAQGQEGAIRAAANVAVLRDQLKELEREKAEGMLAEADFRQAESELQRRLLEESQGDAPAQGATAASSSSGGKGQRNTLLALFLAVPLLASGGYALLGTPKGLDPAEIKPKNQAITPEMITAMVARLEERLKANPDDLPGWVMLARSYRVMGRNAEAADAYAKAETVVNEDADLLADYAETLVLVNKSGFRGKPSQLLAKALKLDPQNGRALMLAGAAAIDNGRPDLAVNLWEKLLPMVEPGSEVEQILKKGIEKAKNQMANKN